MGGQNSMFLTLLRKKNYIFLMFFMQIVCFCHHPWKILPSPGTKSADANAEVVFLVMLGTSSFLARHEVYCKTTENLMPSWERARTQHD